MENLVLSEANFDEFRKFCREKGFDLCYSSPEILGSKEKIEGYQFDSPKVIKLSKRRFGFLGIPYYVAEWQAKEWSAELSGLKEQFSEKTK